MGVKCQRERGGTNEEDAAPSFLKRMVEQNPFETIGQMRDAILRLLHLSNTDDARSSNPDHGVYLPRDLAFDINHNTTKGTLPGAPQRYINWILANKARHYPGMEHGLFFYYVLKIMDGLPDMQTEFLRNYTLGISKSTDSSDLEHLGDIAESAMYDDGLLLRNVDAGKTFQVYKAGPHNFSHQIARQSIGTNTESTVPAVLSYSGMIGYASVMRQQLSEVETATVVVILDSHIQNPNDTYGFVVRYDGGSVEVTPISEPGKVQELVQGKELMLIDDTRSTGKTLARVRKFCDEGEMFTHVAGTRCAFNPRYSAIQHCRSKNGLA